MIFLGRRDDVSHLGYVLGTCPNCHVSGTFTVYFSKRKLTFMLVLALPMSENLVAECTACGHRMAVPENQQGEFRERLIGTEQLAELSARSTKEQRTNHYDHRPRQRTAYQVLQVDPYADPEVVQAAFKRLAFKYHPDRATNHSSEELMRDLTQAYEILADPVRRAQYDMAIGIPRKAPPIPAMRPEDV